MKGGCDGSIRNDDLSGQKRSSRPRIFGDRHLVCDQLLRLVQILEHVGTIERFANHDVGLPACVHHGAVRLRKHRPQKNGNICARGASLDLIDQAEAAFARHHRVGDHDIRRIAGDDSQSLIRAESRYQNVLCVAKEQVPSSRV